MRARRVGSLNPMRAGRQQSRWKQHSTPTAVRPLPDSSTGLARVMLALNQFCVETPSILAANVCW
jgi:hypothetical protein